jgi:DNA-binding MarR family transcriptional regulator
MIDTQPHVLDHLEELVEELSSVSKSVRTLYSPGMARGSWMGWEDGAELATFLFNVRQAWAETFEAEACDDGAWDILLELAKSEMAGEAVTVTKLCSATSRPQTSALRKLKALVKSGFVVRRPDARDGRKVLVELTDKTRRSMELLFQRAVGTGLRQTGAEAAAH